MDGQASKKQVSKTEQLRAKAEHNHSEAITKVNCLEERVVNLGKLIEQLETQLKSSGEELEAMGREREADQRQHEEAMAEKERKLQEYFCKKLDRKVTRVTGDHKREIEELTRGHEHQIVLFEQEF